MNARRASLEPSAPLVRSRQAFAQLRFHETWSPSAFDRARATRVRQLLARFATGPLLDLGTYDGQFAAAVAPSGLPLVGVDVAEDALGRAAARGVFGVRAQAESTLPFRETVFGTVLAAEVIEHVFDTEAFLREVHRVMRPGGHLVLTTPNLVALSGRLKLLLGKSPANVEFDASPLTSGHIRYFTFDTLETLLRRTGLVPVGRWTNVAHFSVLGSSARVGALLPGLGHTLISVARRPLAAAPALPRG